MTILLTVEEAAHELRVCRATVYALLQAGDLPSVQLGRSRRIRRADLEAYVNRLAGEVDYHALAAEARKRKPRQGPRVLREVGA
jgi:excisionase family DNA binding protein